MAQKNLRLLILSFAALLLVSIAPTFAQETGVTSICPATPIQARGATFQPGGAIWTTFDRTATWVYEIDTGRRYPLPDTTPCGRNCRLSPDARWITYYNRPTQTFNRMRLNGTQRRLVIESATDVEWWSDTRFFVWTPAHQGFVYDESTQARESYDVRGISTVQPNGVWGLQVLPRPDGESFSRALVDVNNHERLIDLGVDTAYYNARAWSPDGHTLAFVAPLPVTGETASGSEILLVRPDENPLAPTTLTNLRSAYGSARINGLSVGELRWSPDGFKIAFWVTDVQGDDPFSEDNSAVIHVVDVATGATRSYCGFSTTETAPNPPRLIWSPDSTHIAFGGNVEDDELGVLLLALNIETGTFTRLSDGLYPALGVADVIAWGLLPN